MVSSTTTPSAGQPGLSSDQVLRIARLDAEQAYRDLTPYRISIILEPDGWHIDYELKASEMNGGGAHYIIDPLSGQIIARTYEQ